MKEEYLKLYQSYLDLIVETIKKKNADYTAGDEDPFLNFKVAAEFCDTSVEKQLFSRMMDKIMRMRGIVGNEHEVQLKEESLEDTCIDLAGYAIILACWGRMRKNDI